MIYILGEFMGKAASLLDRRFLLAYWYPTLLSISAGLLIYSWPKDWKPLNQYFSALQSGDYSSQLMIILGTLLITLVLANLLQVFSHPFVQFWEGYWPESLWNWYKNKKGVEKRWNQLKEERKTARDDNPNLYMSLHEKLFYGYPSQKDRLLPTQLGNTLRAAEDYAHSKYGMDAVFWWPRLWLILPEAVQQQIDDSLAPIIALLNLATQIGIISLIGFIYLCMQYTGPWQLWAFLAACITLVVGIIVTTVAYRGAVSQARVYGLLIRSVVDIYRFDLLKVFHQSMPSNIAQERKLWDNLFKWIYLNERENIPPYVHDQSKP